MVITIPGYLEWFLRNVLENPGWYTALILPIRQQIAQGRPFFWGKGGAFFLGKQLSNCVWNSLEWS